MGTYMVKRCAIMHDFRLSGALPAGGAPGLAQGENITRELFARQKVGAKFWVTTRLSVHQHASKYRQWLRNVAYSFFQVV